MSMYMKNELLSGILVDATESGGELENVKVGLFVNDDFDASDKDLVWSDLTPCTAGGYSISDDIVWAGAYVSPDTGLAYMLGDTKSFEFTGNTGGEVVYGYYIQKGTSVPQLLAIEFFEESILPAADTVIPVAPRIGLSDLAVQPEGALVSS